MTNRAGSRQGQDCERSAVEYLIKIAAMDDEALYRECRENIGKFAFSDEATSLDGFWMTSACFKEAKRRGKSEIYSRAYDDNGKTEIPPLDLMSGHAGCANPSPFDFKAQNFSNFKGSNKTTINTVGSHKLSIDQFSSGALFIWMDENGIFRCEAARSTAAGGAEVIKDSLHIGDRDSSQVWLAEWWPKMLDAEK